MKKALFLICAVLALTMTGWADTIVISGDGEQWIGGTPIGGGTGTTVSITPHPAWQPNNPDGTAAVWVSYADTGYMGSVLTPPNGTAANPDGTDVIMTVVEDIVAGVGDVLTMKIWADDTARVSIDGQVLITENRSQSICADGAIGCEPGEFGFVNYTFLTSGQHTLSLDVFQVGPDTTTELNPFGVLYEGQVTAVPEPGSLLLLGTGLAGLCLAAFRRNRG